MNTAIRMISRAALVAIAAGCASTPKTPFEAPTQHMRQEIERKISEIPFTREWERINALDWLTRCGESAFNPLIAALDSSDSDIRAGAANVLGRSLDRRLIPYLSKRADDADPRVRYEFARSLLRLGDWSKVPALISGLRDESEYARALCNDALRQYTKADFGFQPGAPKEQREEPIRKWENWWNARTKDAFFGKDKNSSRVSPKSAGTEGPPAKL